MTHLSRSAALFIVFSLSTWTIAQTIECGELQYKHKGRCCKDCPPGTYLKDFCSGTRETVCLPCPDGFYADKHHCFDRCERCRSCPAGKTAICTPTSNGNCLCRPGFLCSDHDCMHCEENKCAAGEEPKRIDSRSKQYSYQCEPKCPGKQYFDTEENICKQRTQCSLLGLDERFPGNITHDSVCEKPEKDDTRPLYWIISIGFVLLSLTLFVFVFHTCSKILMRSKKDPAARRISVQLVPSKTSDFHLSKEESGIQLIIEDGFKSCCSVSELDLEDVSALS
ncbi:tumor necrosis factor receptor superfamily member 18 [Fundulus diaphanus]